MARKTSGKYMFIGKPSRFGADIRYSDTLKDLKLSLYDKGDIRLNESLLFVADGEQIKRINSNGRSK